jgi:hypothetical protein
MQVKQIHEIINNVTTEVIGESAVVNEDFTNLVDMGKAVFQADAVDNYVAKLVDRIGKVVFVDRPYSGSVPSIFMDSFEYGAVVEKIAADMPEAVENKSWELHDGQSYDPNVFYKPAVSAKFFNSKTTFEIDLSFTQKQVKESFAGINELNAFLTMLYNAVAKSMTVKTDSLIMRTINNLTATTLADAYPDGGTSGYGTAGNTRAVNLLALYNAKFPDATVKAADALTNPEFIRFASMQMGLYTDRLSRMSTLFNIGGAARFTPTDMLHIVMLTDFKAAANAYLQSDTFHNEFTALPSAETVPYWQGSGTDYAFDSVSAINVKTAGGKTVSTKGILAVMFDTDACGVCNTDKRVTTNFNPKAEFYTNFYKFDASYFNDENENFVVFFIADAASA